MPAPAALAGDLAPRIAGARAWLDCRVWAQYDAGDHTLFVGGVLSVESGAAGRALAYVGGTYVAL